MVELVESQIEILFNRLSLDDSGSSEAQKTDNVIEQQIYEKCSVIDLLRYMEHQLLNGIGNVSRVHKKLNNLFAAADMKWLCPKNGSLDKFIALKKYVSFIQSVTDFYIQQLLQESEEHSTLQDFDKTVLNAVKDFITIISTLFTQLFREDSVIDQDYKDLWKMNAVGLSILCAATSITCDCKAAQNLLSIASHISKCARFSDLLTASQDDSHSLFREILNLIQPKLKRDTWKKSILPRYIFEWFLGQVKLPHLSEYLDLVLVPSLLCVDDYIPDNKVLGIKCLSHILHNTSSAELQWYGRAEVIYDALSKQLYQHDVSIVNILHPCLLQCLSVVEHDPRKTDQPREYNRYDTAFTQLLKDAGLASGIALRRAYTKHLPSYVDTMGITVVKHLNVFLEVLVVYLEQYDGPEETARINMLKTLETVIVTGWPRMPFHCNTIVKCLLKLITDIALDKTLTPPKVKNNLVSKATYCLVLMKRCCHGKVESIIHSLADEENLPKLLQKSVKETLEAK